MKRNDTYSVHVFYAFSWYFDRGDPALKWYTHLGDSEWIVMEAKYGNGKWA